MRESTQAPGFFGKLPSHGDFVSRRLPPAVRDCFDEWLQSALLQSRQDLGEAWLPTWLSSPLWRFVVGPGVCGEQAWAGVMMPSHDRVGRCFPLLLTAPVDGTPLLRACLTLHGGWFERLEDLALSTLEEGFTLEAFDAALSVLGTLPPGSGRATFLCSLQEVPSLRAVALPLEEASPARIDPLLASESAWWTDGSQRVAPYLALCCGLPAPASFTALLDGRWAERGWSSTLSG